MKDLTQYDICSGLDSFTVIGINYHKANTTTRSDFAVCASKLEIITRLTKQHQVNDLIVLSTCNRTELYGTAPADTLIDFLCSATQNIRSHFDEIGYVLHGMEAVNHLFKVAAGLDSQIIGDYEILMQLKKAAQYARENGLLATLADRLVNFSLQASKRIKSETQLSTGTVSVAYAAIEVIREKVPDIQQKKILLVGAGKFGRNVAKNILEYFPGTQISITNRTREKAEGFAGNNGMKAVPYTDLARACNEADILITSTTAGEFTILPDFFSNQKQRLLLDLSVPKCIDPAVCQKEGIVLMDVDQISAILDKTFAKRRAEIPKALAIINETLGEFVEWHKIFSHRHFLSEVKSKLYELSESTSCPASIQLEEKDIIIQKAVKTLAVDLRRHTAKGCQYINTMHEYLKISHS